MESIFSVHIKDFEVHDFVEDPNLDQFIDLIRWEHKDAIYNFNSKSINEAFIVDNSFLSHPAIPFDHCNSNSVNVYHPISYTHSSFSCFDGEAKEEGGGEEDNMGDSSATTTTTTTTTKSVNPKPIPKTDRSKTLISERRRRDRMKQKLYALWSLVPNITKMDKASIIGDAVSYMHELQAQANMLKAEVQGLETSLLDNRSICKKIIKMDMFQVDEKGFYVKIVCNKGEGVAASLCKSLESLTGFNVQSSNLATVSDSFQLTFSLNAKGPEPEFNLPNLEVMGD
ncbi:hypothetical protein AAZX31_12G077400 [Glycine max]